MPITRATGISPASGHSDVTPDHQHDNQPISQQDVSRVGPGLRELEKRLKEQRRRVIRQAKLLDKEINFYKRKSNSDLHERGGPLLDADRTLQATRESLRTDGMEELDTTKPSLTLWQASRNVAVLTGGAASLVGAAAVAGTAPIFYGAYCAPGTATFVVGSPFIAAYAAWEQWHSESSVMSTVPRRIAKSTKKGAQVFVACATSPLWAPFHYMFERGSYVKNAVRSMNRFPEALTYVKYSTSSTYDIAMKVDGKAARTLAKIEKKFERWPGARRGPTPTKMVPPRRALDGLLWVEEIDGEALDAEPRFENGSLERPWFDNLFKCA